MRRGVNLVVLIRGKVKWLLKSPNMMLLQLCLRKKNMLVVLIGGAKR